MTTTLSSRKRHYLKALGIFLILAALMAAIVGCVGLPSEHLEIRTWHDLDAIRDNLGGSYVLINDLDATTAGYEELAGSTANRGYGWQPIGGSPGNPFRGTLDGRGYKITGLYVNRPWEIVGLFGFVADEGEVRNVRVTNADITGGSRAGGLVGSNYGVVTSSCSTGSVRGNDYTGGLVGANRGTVSKSYSAGNVTTSWSGHSSFSLPLQYATGDPLHGATGGLIGWNEGTVADSYSRASVREKNSVGGLVGANIGQISRCYATGSLYAYETFGLVVGAHGVASNSFWDVETTGTDQSGGGVGRTTAEMKQESTFAEAGWDFENVWDINEMNEGYPFLSWQSVG